MTIDAFKMHGIPLQGRRQSYSLNERVADVQPPFIAVQTCYTFCVNTQRKKKRFRKNEEIGSGLQKGQLYFKLYVVNLVLMQITSQIGSGL